MIVLGVDPDLHTTALALASETLVYGVRIIRVPRTLKGEKAVFEMSQALASAVYQFCDGHDSLGSGLGGIVVEGQQAYIGGRSIKATPADLLNLAFVAGAACCGAKGYTDAPARRPLPNEWKGSVPKEIHQARILDKYRLTPESLRKIPGGEDIADREWNHIIDAIGLARWGATVGFK